MLEPVVQQLGRRHRQDAQQVDDRLFAQTPRFEAEPGKAEQLAEVPGLHVRRRHGVQRLEEAGEPVHAAAERRPLGRVGGAEPPDRLGSPGDVLPQLEAVPTGERHGDPRVRSHDLEPVAVECQVANDRRRHPSGGERAPPVTFPALLEHQHPPPRSGEGVRRDQPVCARADDDRVGRHAPSPSIARAARRPDAPMMPPPGCVPAPHWYSPRTGVR